jgi:hypothetical protein
MFFEVEWEPRNGILVSRCIGIWDQGILGAYRSALFEALDVACRDRFDHLVDTRKSSAQPKALSDGMEVLIKELTARGLRRAAVVTSSAIMRAQLNRVGSSNHQFFKDEGAAREWLMDARQINNAAEAV